jgi:Archaeal phage integrase
MFESEAHIERGWPSLVGRGIANPQVLPSCDSNSLCFKSYLKAQKKRNVRQIMCYAQEYHTILETGDASILSCLESSTIRRHAMEALSCLSKCNGTYDRWQEIRRRYNLRWTLGNESLHALHRVFDTELNLDVMLNRIKKMVDVLPHHMGHIIRFGVITGLRPSEAVESVRLINNEETFHTYYNKLHMALEHFSFPEIFLRRTKKAFISFVTSDMIELAKLDYIKQSNVPAYNAIRHALNRKGLNMNMSFARKVFASHLRLCGVQPEIVDMLQGRVSTSKLTRHYLVPNNSLRDQVLDAIQKLKRDIT